MAHHPSEFQNLNRFIGIVVEFLPATNHRPRRLKLTIPRFAARRIVSAELEIFEQCNSALECGFAWIRFNGFGIAGIVPSPDTILLGWTDHNLALIDKLFEIKG